MVFKHINELYYLAEGQGNVSANEKKEGRVHGWEWKMCVQGKEQKNEVVVSC